MAFCRCNFISEAVNISTDMNVILPEGASNHEYPTLYLLHGYTDDCNAWMRWTSIERYACEYKLAVIMPDVQKSFYNDFPGFRGGYQYWTFVSEELIDVSRRFFRLSHKREDTFVAGLSMGGFGAFKCALNRPDVFAAAASLSGVMDLAGHLETCEQDKEIEMMVGSLESLKGGVNDLFAAAEKTAERPEKPRLYQFCGTEDFLYENNVRFRDFIQKLNFNYEYEESPGGHEWVLWDREIKKFIDTLNLEKA